MKRVGFLLILLVMVLTACNKDRVYEQNQDFENQYWLVGHQPEFEFSIRDTLLKYSLYCNLRNDVSYPKANLYFTYYLTDSSGTLLQKKLVSEFLFDRKTGKPSGSSALGDIYDHQIPILLEYKFKHPGKYKVKFEQFMRTDSLEGILAVGLKVEKSIQSHN